MTRAATIAIGLMLTCGLSACGVGPGLTGNSTGGIIQWTPDNQRVATEWAEQHCARYGKIAYHVIVDPNYGQYISFDCAFPPGGAAYGYAY
ncbi:MAG TPA: hypothetical protein VFA57_20525 [Pseudolabrys sp.]|jgi:hypothetical protein|nr:hypothetical protein [Pseudolabrys sp.]